MINPPKLDWMIFRPEGNDVLYIWDGKFPVLLHVPAHEGTDKEWYWAGITADISPSEIALLQDVAKTKRKQVFTVPRKGKRRYQVVTRGTYEHTNK